MTTHDVALAKVKVSWDVFGKIKHDLITDLECSPKQKDEILGYCAVVCFESQLGVMPVNRALILSARVLNFIERNEMLYEPINSSLKGVEIEIIKGKGVYHRFDPKLGFFTNNDSIEDGVSQFLGNFLSYAYKNTLSEGVPLRIKIWTLYALKLFLNDILCPLISEGTVRNANKNYPEIERKTKVDALGLYETWDKYQAFHLQMDSTKRIFEETIPLCRTKLDAAVRELGLS